MQILDIKRMAHNILENQNIENRPLPPVTIDALNSDRSFDRRQYINKELKDMFFSLNLIESYGSGIRRAKDSLFQN